MLRCLGFPTPKNGYIVILLFYVVILLFYVNERGVD